MRSKYYNSRSFAGKTRVVFALLWVLPSLVVVYLFAYEQIEFTEMMLLFSALALFSALTGFSLMRRSSDQLVKLARETSAIELGKANKLIYIGKTADEEVNDIAVNFNYMLKRLNDLNREIKEQSVKLMVYSKDLSISYEKIKEDEELRNKLSRYVGDNLINKLVDSKGKVFFENERREVTILFADIRSFSLYSETTKAEDVVAMLNQFFSAMVDIVFRNQGILDKFIGDAIMAVFGVVSSDDISSCNAVKAALEMQHVVDQWMKARKKEGKETFEIGIGINTGHVIVGNVGSENRMDYTVIGDSVNIAAKLEEIAKGGEIIIGQHTYFQTMGHFNVQKMEKVYIQNKIEPVMCYKVLK